MNYINRNKYVIKTNEQSVKIDNIFRYLDLNVKNIIETARDTIFSMAYELEKYGYDFWDDDFILRDCIIYHMNSKAVGAIEDFINNYSYCKIPFVPKVVVLASVIDKYNAANNYIASCDLREDYYRIVCEYCKSVYPSSDMRDRFYEVFVEFCSIGNNISAVESEEYNNKEMFSILDGKAKDSEILEKALVDPEKLSDEEFIEIIEVAVKNYRQMYDSSDNAYTDKLDNEIQKAKKRKRK